MANELKYRDVIKEKNYVVLLFTNLINRFGDSIDAIAFTWLVYQITGSASWAALIFGLNVLPNIVAQPFFGAMVEKMDKKKVIIFTHLLRVAVIGSFVVMYMVGVVNPYIMAAFTLIITTIESLNMPASSAFIPQIIKKEHMSHAMSLNSSLSNAVALVGTGVAGVIIAKLGVQTAMLIDAATFLAAGIGMFFIKVNGETAGETAPEQEQATAEKTSKESYISLLKGGIKYIASNRVILNYCFVAVLLNFFMVPLNALQAPLSEEVYGLGSELLSVIGMAASVGAIFGSLVIPKLMARFSARKILIRCGFAMGIFSYTLSLGKLVHGMAVPGYILGSLSVVGITFACSIISGTLSIQFVNTVDRDYLARASSVFGASATAAMPVGSLIISFAATRLSTEFLVGMSGVLAILLFIAIAISKMDFDMKEQETEELADAA
ncbi:MAG: MFS transporter [Lachnospiraceae bacterium]|nr:MFS transporter [Lachnospiraceae bacterium]MBR5993886.1 MFS transporter [Lachnospiraceae bacterium]